MATVTDEGTYSGETASQTLSVSREWHGAAIVLAVAGSVDMATVSRFEDALQAALGERPRLLVLELSQVGFFASAGLNALVAAQQQAGADTAVRLVATHRAVVRPLEVTGLTGTIPIASSVELALGEQ